MTGDSKLPSPGIERCWLQIGVWGDRTCPELKTAGHCHNCLIYRQSGFALLERPAPSGYLEEWANLIAGAGHEERAVTSPYLVFRVGRSWLALRAVALREVARPSVVRKLPHRTSTLLLGLTAVRGEIHLCVSLHTLLGEGSTDLKSAGVRMLLARHEDKDWVFPVDEIDGIREIGSDAHEPLPATLAHSGTVYTSAIAAAADRAVGIVDEGLVFAAFERGIA